MWSSILIIDLFSAKNEMAYGLARLSVSQWTQMTIATKSLSGTSTEHTIPDASSL